MKRTVLANLNGTNENYILPFFWQHGEEESTLRGYMNIIHSASIGAVCVESRPHPDFCGPRWWRDMDIILDEAKKLGMKVWILDDSHFPTGYANGAVIGKEKHLRRQSLARVSKTVKGNGKEQEISIQDLLKKNPQKPSLIGMFTSQGVKKDPVTPKDELIGLCAAGPDGKLIDLTGKVAGGKLKWLCPEGEWKLTLTKASWRMGAHPSYINMSSEDSCRILIDTVYEPHWEHYKDEFGKTIAGFFSDEPELGNGAPYSHEKMGFDQDLPWSDELKEALKARWGDAWRAKLLFLWDDYPANVPASIPVSDKDAPNEKRAARIRFEYMDELTRLVQKAFSEQVGNWCRAHGVMYIGHVVEDLSGHARTGGALGHYFRGLWGQDMAGIDDIGGQVLPQGEDTIPYPTAFDKMRPRDGEFFHYELPQLGASLASLDPKKQGRAMCEIFGNYGWLEGFRLEKYLADHFMVYGINHFVPHAFSAKAFPDPDCPPHFYAHGHNPQFRHFGSLMRYMNRVCGLISDGVRITRAAVLYHAEAEWMGRCMNDQKVLRQLADHQIGADIVPADALLQPEVYPCSLQSGSFTINTQTYQALIIPHSTYITDELAASLEALLDHHIPVYFIDALPKAVIPTSDVKASSPAEKDSSQTDAPAESWEERLSRCRVIPLDQLVKTLREEKIADILPSPESNRLRVLHYQKDNEDLYYFVNESDAVYTGEVLLPSKGSCYRYDAWQNRLEKAHAQGAEAGTLLSLTLNPLDSYLLIFGQAPAALETPLSDRIEASAADGSLLMDSSWTRSTASALDYPAFTEEKKLFLPDDLAGEKPGFSGWVRYENTFRLPEGEAKGETYLVVTDAYEGLELFVNGQSAGIQVVPPYRYDISSLVKAGENRIRIDVSTTLERERSAAKNKGMNERLFERKEKAPTGITGRVLVYHS